MPEAVTPFPQHRRPIPDDAVGQMIRDIYASMDSHMHEQQSNAYVNYRNVRFDLDENVAVGTVASCQETMSPWLKA